MKNKWLNSDDEFYIGYLPEAPAKTGKVLRKIIFTLGIVIALIATILIFSQKGFPDTQFDYGNYSTVRGYIYQEPIPYIAISQPDSTYKNIVLVGEGKQGAAEQLKKLIGTSTGPVYGEISGQLIDGYNKSLLQIDRHSSFTQLKPSAPIGLNKKKSLNKVTLKGEVVDPKCYFGVMKPGEGKPHRSCAIRCIAGGIPPVFHSGNNYYLLLSDKQEPVNDEVLALVGDQILLDGEVAEFGDWKFLLVPTLNLSKLAAVSSLRKKLFTLDENITICKN